MIPFFRWAFFEFFPPPPPGPPPFNPEVKGRPPEVKARRAVPGDRGTGVSVPRETDPPRSV